MASGAMAGSLSTASRESCVGFGTFAERAPRVTARRACAPLAALGGLGRRTVGRDASSAAWRKAGFGSRARRTVDRRPVIVPRARAGDASGSKWVRGLGASSRNDEDPLSGALHQTRGLRERLADLAGGGEKPSPGADVAKSDESDWDHWQEVIDKADAEDQILTALEVRLSVPSRRRFGALFSGKSFPKHATRLAPFAFFSPRCVDLRPSSFFHLFVLLSLSSRRPSRSRLAIRRLSSSRRCVGRISPRRLR